jgi:hypothetical protein
LTLETSAAIELPVIRATATWAMPEMRRRCVISITDPFEAAWERKNVGRGRFSLRIQVRPAKPAGWPERAHVPSEETPIKKPRRNQKLRRGRNREEANYDHTHPPSGNATIFWIFCRRAAGFSNRRISGPRGFRPASAHDSFLALGSAKTTPSGGLAKLLAFSDLVA